MQVAYALNFQIWCALCDYMVIILIETCLNYFWRWKEISISISITELRGICQLVIRVEEGAY